MQDTTQDNRKTPANVIPFKRAATNTGKPFAQGVHANTPATMTAFERYNRDEEILKSGMTTIFVKAANPDMPDSFVRQYIHGALGKVLEKEEGQESGVFKVALKEINLPALKDISSIQVIEPNRP